MWTTANATKISSVAMSTVPFERLQSVEMVKRCWGIWINEGCCWSDTDDEEVCVHGASATIL